MLIAVEALFLIVLPVAGGGVVGLNGGSTVLACYATGNVTSTGSSTGYMHIGGFLGNNYTTVTAC